jgi:hypothetical protein
MRNIIQVINPAKVMVFITGFLFITCLLLASSVVMLNNIIKSYEFRQDNSSNSALFDKNYQDKNKANSNLDEVNIEEVTAIVANHHNSYQASIYYSNLCKTSSCNISKIADKLQLASGYNQFVILPSKKFNIQDDTKNYVLDNSAMIKDFTIPYRFESSAKLGNKRSIGDGKLFLPLYQNDEGDKLLFADLRGRFDNIGSAEYNVGIGFRRLITGTSFLNQDAWIVGAYGFLDHLRSKNNNNFLQTTLGVEAMSEKYDFRANFYLPHSREKMSSFMVYVADKDGDGVKEYYENHSKEKPFIGGDLEFGYKLPINWAKIKLFAGGYYFKGEKDYSSILGHRGRAEISFTQDNLKILPKDLEFTLGGEYQNDKIRGKQIFAVAKVSYQFGSNYVNYRNSKNFDLTNLKNRMNEFLVRDIDVVTTEKKSSPNRASGFKDGIDNRDIYFIDAEKALNQALIDSLPENSIIILDGSKGKFNINNNSDTKKYLTLKTGQIISTENTDVTISSEALKGQKIATTIKTIRANIESNVDINGGYLIGMNNNSGIENLAINQNIDSSNVSGSVINVDGKENVAIRRVTLNNNSNVENGKKLAAIHIEGGSKNIIIAGRNINGSSVDIKGYHNAIDISGSKYSSDIILSDLYISDNSGYGINIENANKVKLTGNITSNNNNKSGIKLKNISNLNNYSHLTANNNNLDNLDINKVSGSNFGNVTANNSINGSGIRITDSNIVANNVTTMDNSKLGANISEESIFTYSQHKSLGNKEGN